MSLTSIEAVAFARRRDPWWQVDHLTFAVVGQHATLSSKASVADPVACLTAGVGRSTGCARSCGPMLARVEPLDALGSQLPVGAGVSRAMRPAPSPTAMSTTASWQRLRLTTQSQTGSTHADTKRSPETEEVRACLMAPCLRSAGKPSVPAACSTIGNPPEATDASHEGAVQGSRLA